MRWFALVVLAGCGRIDFGTRADAARNVDTVGVPSADAVGMPGDGSTTGIVCGEATCQPVSGAYISHFDAKNCGGTESYYTPYFSGTSLPNPDGKINSWDGNGLAGTVYHTVKNYSYKDTTGVCTDAWPQGNTLDYFVTIYR